MSEAKKILTARLGPSVIVAAVNGRHAHRSGPLKGKNMHVHVTDYADAVVIRLDDDTAPDFWLEITLKPNTDDAAALARMADDGCQHCG